MPAAVPIIAAVVAAAGTTYSAINANQQEQHAKGAAQVQAAAEQGQINTANAQDKANQQQKADQGSATQTAALAALKASMSSASGYGGTLLTGPQGTGSAAPTQAKTLLGA